MAPSGERKQPAKAPARRRASARTRGSASGATGQTADRDRQATGAAPAAAGTQTERGVFSSLPSTRPQRPSARRAAAQRARADATGEQESVPRTGKRDTDGASAPASATSAATPPASQSSAAAGSKAPKQRKTPPRRTAAKAPASPRVPRVPPREPREPPVPPQGFESETEIEPGTTVQPPSSGELAASLAELLGDLAHGGVTAGGRLLKDALGRLRGG
jgi:hypothetical protein